MNTTKGIANIPIVGKSRNTESTNKKSTNKSTTLSQVLKSLYAIVSY